MKILLFGRNGQVGYELERSLQGLGDIIATDSKQINFAHLEQVRKVIVDVQPKLIINAAAYTAVDQAESEADLAMRINGEAPGVIAEEAKKVGATIIHYSTDYVFDGSKSTPYTEDDLPCPINAYGRSKLAGEEAVKAAGVPYVILRTSWVYGMRRRNFLRTVLRQAQEQMELHIVADQHGAPTWCRTVADTTAHIVGRLFPSTLGRRTDLQQDRWQELSGVYHLAAQGQTTWHGFAQTIVAHSSVIKKPVVTPIKTQEYPLPARRPLNSIMSCERLMKTFCGLPNWGSALRLCLE